MNDGKPRRVWAYLAGPYTHPDPVLNTRNVIMVAEAVRAMGHVPIVPHLSMLWHLVSPHDIEFWYDYDLELLARCDVLILLSGASSGADREVEVAGRLGIPVVLLSQDSNAWLHTITQQIAGGIAELHSGTEAALAAVPGPQPEEVD